MGIARGLGMDTASGSFYPYKMQSISIWVLKAEK